MAFSSLACTSSFLGCKETSSASKEQNWQTSDTSQNPKDSTPFPHPKSTVPTRSRKTLLRPICQDFGSSIVMPCHGKSRKESKVWVEICRYGDI
jgi:hypothetical protein